jgi:AraC-like DNA-binding protein
MNETLVAYHEAGHAVIALRLGLLRKKGASIVPNDYSSGRVHPRRGRGEDGDISNGQAQLLAERHVMICMAGIEAERRHNPRSARSWHFESDRDQAIDWLGTVCEFSSDQFAAYWKLLQIRTRDMVQAHWWRIEAVAARLLVSKTLTGDQIREVIQEAVQRRLAEARRLREAKTA